MNEGRRVWGIDGVRGKKSGNPAILGTGKFRQM